MTLYASTARCGAKVLGFCTPFVHLIRSALLPGVLSFCYPRPHIVSQALSREPGRTAGNALTRVASAVFLLVLGFLLVCLCPLARSEVGYAATWSAELQVNQDDEYDDSNPGIAVDTSGTSWIVWMGLDPVQLDEEVYWSSWQNGGWTYRQRVHSDNSVNDRFPEIATGKLDGVPWVVWARYNPGSGQYDFLVSHWVGSAWVEPETVFTAGARYDAYDIVARDTSLVWVVWSTRSHEGAQDREILARKRENGVWGSIEQILKPDSDDWEPRVDMDSGCRVWVVWDATNYVFSAVRSDTGWTQPVLVKYGPDGAMVPSIAVDGSDIPWVVWSNGNPYGGTDVFSARWEADQWVELGAVNLADEPEAEDRNAVIAAVPSSGPLVIWWGGLPKYATHMDIYESKWTAYGWRQEARVSTPDSVFLALDEWPSVAVSRGGRAWVCWERMGKVAPYDYDIWARYSDNVVPVEGVRGFTAEVRGGSVRLSWQTDEYGWFEVYRKDLTSGVAAFVILPVQSESLDTVYTGCEILVPAGAGLISATPVMGKGKLEFEDADVLSGSSYLYSLGQVSVNGCRVYGSVRADVPGSAVPDAPRAWVVATPNPFRSSCVVRSSAGNAAHIFDLHGRLLRVLLPTEKTAGATEGDYASFFWDGRDKDGKEVASGIYIVKVSDSRSPGTKEVIGKLVLLR